uniref:Uncharacterized protein n=1 Tax=viral metagenome TaxID=1070528 RepID=A0A6M3KY98_9ZZZZ
MTIPKSKYKCQQCNTTFELDKPGPTKCPKCGHVYVDWLNHIEVLKALHRWEDR